MKVAKSKGKISLYTRVNQSILNVGRSDERLLYCVLFRLYTCCDYSCGLLGVTVPRPDSGTEGDYRQDTLYCRAYKRDNVPCSEHGQYRTYECYYRCNCSVVHVVILPCFKRRIHSCPHPRFSQKYRPGSLLWWQIGAAKRLYRRNSH